MAAQTGGRVISVDFDEAMTSTQAKLAVAAAAGVSYVGVALELLPGLITFMAGLSALLLSIGQLYIGLARNRRHQERHEALLRAVNHALSNAERLDHRIELESPAIQRIQKAMRDSRSGKRPLESIREFHQAMQEFEELDK